MLKLEKVGAATWVGWTRGGMYTVQGERGGVGPRFVASFQSKTGVDIHKRSEGVPRGFVLLGKFDTSRDAMTAAQSYFAADRLRR